MKGGVTVALYKNQGFQSPNHHLKQQIKGYLTVLVLGMI